MEKIRRDSLLSERYSDASSVIEYVRSGVGTKAFEAQYGKWPYSDFQFYYEKNQKTVETDHWYIRKEPVDLGENDILLMADDYQCSYWDQRVVISHNDDVVLDYPIRKVVRSDKSLLDQPAKLLTYRNDSLLLVLEGICIEDTIVSDVRTYSFQLFKKRTINTH